MIVVTLLGNWDFSNFALVTTTTVLSIIGIFSLSCIDYGSIMTFIAFSVEALPKILYASSIASI